jgi:hypothetical protein
MIRTSSPDEPGATGADRVARIAAVTHQEDVR